MASEAAPVKVDFEYVFSIANMLLFEHFCNRVGNMRHHLCLQVISLSKLYLVLKEIYKTRCCKTASQCMHGLVGCVFSSCVTTTTLQMSIYIYIYIKSLFFYL